VRKAPAASSVTIIRIANLRAVPSAFRAYVKRKFQSPNSEGKAPAPVLLDWEGQVAKAYGAIDDLTNVYLIDDKGMLRYSASGKGTPDETRTLLDGIASLGPKE